VQPIIALHAACQIINYCLLQLRLSFVLLQFSRKSKFHNLKLYNIRGIKMIKRILLIAVASTLITACASNTPNYGQNYGLNGMNKAVIGGGIGAVTGAALGTAFGGNDLGNAGMGALVGGAVGAGVGALVDHQQKKQQQQQQGGWYQNQPYSNGYNQ
jgi:Glycine zipper